MTRVYQKDIEVLYAEKVSELLNKTWDVAIAPNESNWPDLCVRTEWGGFGLEVREIYLDEASNGSGAKASESENSKHIRKLSGDYYRSGNPPIMVKFWDSIEQIDRILDSLISTASQLSEWELLRVRPYDSCRIDVRRLPDSFVNYNRWCPACDQIGWVASMPEHVLNNVIAEKAQNLQKYAMNMSEVRLLLVSNRRFKSGKARLGSDITCDPCGFSKVYYLSFPEEAWTISP